MGLITSLLLQKGQDAQQKALFEHERDQSIINNPQSSEAQYQAALDRMIDAAAPTPAHAKGMKAIIPRLLQRNTGTDAQTGQPYNHGMANATGVDSTNGDAVAWGPNGEITRTPKGMGPAQPGQQVDTYSQPPGGQGQPVQGWDGGLSTLAGGTATAAGYQEPYKAGGSEQLPMGGDGRPALKQDPNGTGNAYGPSALAGDSGGGNGGSEDESASAPAPDAGFSAPGVGFIQNPAAAAQKKSIGASVGTTTRVDSTPKAKQSASVAPSAPTVLPPSSTPVSLSPLEPTQQPTQPLTPAAKPTGNAGSTIPPTIPPGERGVPVPGYDPKPQQQQPQMPVFGGAQSSSNGLPSGMGDPYETFDGVPGHPLSFNAKLTRQAMSMLNQGVAKASVDQFVMQQKIAQLQRLREQNPMLPPSQLYALAGIPIPGQAAAESRERVGKLNADSRERVAAGQPVPSTDYVTGPGKVTGFFKRGGGFQETPGASPHVPNAPQPNATMMKYNDNLVAESEYLNALHTGEPGWVPKTVETLTGSERAQAQTPEALQYRQIRKEVQIQNPKMTPQQINQAVVTEIQRQRKIGENAKVVRAEIGVKQLDNMNQRDERAITLGQGLLDGTVAPTMVNVTRETKEKAQAWALEHGYNGVVAELDYLAMQSHIRTSEGPVVFRQITALDKLLTTIPLLRQAYKNWETYGRAGGIRVFNRASLTLSKNLNSPAGTAANELDRLIAETQPELASIYSAGNTPTDHGLELGKTQLAGEWNGDQFNTALNGIEQFGKIRRNTYVTSQPGQYMGAPNQYQQPQQPQPKEPWRTPPQPGAALTKEIADQYRKLYPDLTQMRTAIQADGWKIPR